MLQLLLDVMICSIEEIRLKLADSASTKLLQLSAKPTCTIVGGVTTRCLCSHLTES